MKIVVTGAETPLGSILAQGLEKRHQVDRLGAEVDLFDAQQVEQALKGAHGLVHAEPYELANERLGEEDLLDRLARGTYVLSRAAAASGVKRLALISRIELLADYPEDYVVRPFWLPQPQASAAELGPYVAELTGREIARTGALELVILRLGALDEPEGTSAADALKGVEEALTVEQLGHGHSIDVRHVVSGGRFSR